MRGLMGDSRLNEAERFLQQMFRKLLFFNGLLMIAVVLGLYGSFSSLPNLKPRPPRTTPITYRPVELPAVGGPLRQAGAWELFADDPRLGGLSALSIDDNKFLAVSDLGAVIRFDSPSAPRPFASLIDLRDGPGPQGKKRARDAESLALDPRGRGWWIGYEQRHSLWLYDHGFDHALAAIDLRRPEWHDNSGAEGLVAGPDSLLVAAENGREAIEVGKDATVRLHLDAGAEVADAARAPDGTVWILLRNKGLNGISQSIAPLLKQGDGYRAGPAWPLPKAALDNYEGMAIERLARGGWRLWLVTDDGHRLMARTLLVALDLPNPPGPRHDESPAMHAGLSKNSALSTP